MAWLVMVAQQAAATVGNFVQDVDLVLHDVATSIATLLSQCQEGSFAKLTGTHLNAGDFAGNHWPNGRAFREEKREAI